MVYINEYTGEKFKSYAECQKSEQDYLMAQQKLEEKKRLDKAKREAAEKEKKNEVKKAYEKAMKATDNAIKALDEYLDIVDKTGYRVESDSLFDLLLNF